MGKLRLFLISSLLLNIVLIAAVATVSTRAKHALSSLPTPTTVLTEIADEIGGSDGDRLRSMTAEIRPQLAALQARIAEGQRRLAGLLAREDASEDEFASVLADIKQARLALIDIVSETMAQLLPSLRPESRAALRTVLLNMAER